MKFDILVPYYENHDSNDLQDRMHGRARETELARRIDDGMMDKELFNCMHDDLQTHRRAWKWEWIHIAVVCYHSLRAMEIPSPILQPNFLTLIYCSNL
jgi:hypothetical protein